MVLEQLLEEWFSFKMLEDDQTHLLEGDADANTATDNVNINDNVKKVRFQGRIQWGGGAGTPLEFWGRGQAGHYILLGLYRISGWPDNRISG